MVLAPAINTPMPSDGESQADFVMRAHRELFAAIPEPEDRNRAVWQAWYSVNGDSEGQRADARFAQDQYVKRPDVCYFSEHEANAVGPDGQPMVRKYDAAKLREIVDENNMRIADVDAYPTIIDRHTAPAGTRDPAPPETLGVAGPFRLGMIGRVNPRFAIFSDEYVRKDKMQNLTNKGGRSVELLTQKFNGRSYINPIAAISEAPRLPLPVQFSFGDADSEIVERYSMIAQYSAPVPAFPGGGNTFVQKFDTTQETGNMQGNDQLIRQIVDAIMNTEQMQWVSQQMGQEGSPVGGSQPGQPGSQPGAQPAPTPPQQPQQFGGGMMQPGMGQMRYQNDESYYTPLEGDADSAEKYAALLSGQQQLVSELAETKSQLAVLAVAKADADRSSRLRELASRMPIDLDAELSRCLYSAGSSFDDDRFEDHLDTIERYCAKSIENMPMLPIGTAPAAAPSLETAKYQAEESALIRTMHNEYVNAGIIKPYDILKAEARQKLASRE